MTNLLIKPAQIQQLKDEADVRSCGSEKPTTRRIFYAGLLCFHQNAKCAFEYETGKWQYDLAWLGPVHAGAWQIYTQVENAAFAAT